MFDGPPKEPSRLARLSQRLVQLPPVRRVLGRLVEPARPPTSYAADHAGGFTVVAAFGDNPGGLHMQAYVPAPAPPAGAPLIVVVHGCTQAVREFATGSGWTAMADRIGAVLVLPEQLEANNRARCFNWFRPGDVTRDGGEVRSIRDMVEWATLSFSSDPARVFIVGLSAGGAMALAGLAAYPEVFAAGAVVAGCPAGGARGVTNAFTLMSGNNSGRSGAEWAEAARELAGLDGTRTVPRLSVWQGTGDQTVNRRNAEAIVSQWLALRGAAPEPSADGASGPVRHRTWEQDGENAVESWTIQGMGHGYPARPVDGRTVSDPYVLPAEVDATTEIARFWGLLAEA